MECDCSFFIHFLCGQSGGGNDESQHTQCACFVCLPGTWEFWQLIVVVAWSCSLKCGRGGGDGSVSGSGVWLCQRSSLWLF